MLNPRDTAPGSIMPNYPWLAENKAGVEKIGDKMSAMQSVGVPYSDNEIGRGKELYLTQAKAVSEGLAKENVHLAADSELTALIAYLQRLGVDGRAAIKTSGPGALPQ